MPYATQLAQLQDELLDMLEPRGSEGLRTADIIDKTLRFRELLGCYRLQVEKSARQLELPGKVRTAAALRGIHAPATHAPALAQLLLWERFLADYRRRLDAAIAHEHEEAAARQLQAKPAVARAARAPATAKDRLLATNKAITSNLIRSNHVLQSSVLQSELNMDELSQQTASLAGLGRRFDQLGLVLHRSAAIVRSIEASSGREKQRVYIALSFLGACIAWVVWRRLLRGPLRLMLWLWFHTFRRALGLMGLLPRSAPAAAPAMYSALPPGPASTAALVNAVDSAFTRIMDEL
ncbi:AaceriAFR344Cp [[Ashbya] aceris (nom. inval.)]|nr:AaceriAFR344Cp [[Ashbya] aceris (nom. inval.)]